MNKKLDVHFVQHTHWDREWYFTSDDSRTMLYYDMKFVIEYLEKNDDVFTFDGQSSVIDDFLRFSPDWEARFKALVKAKKILVGPFYTQTDDVLPAGESIVRNIEVGNKVAKDVGHSMQVGYLPDTFGHNNQIPQILNLNGIDNISFYRGLDPELTNDKLYFWYKAPDGTKVLGHWQTHYSTHGKAFDYTNETFEKYVVEDYEREGQFDPSVKSYAKRNFGLPVGIPIGTDQKPFRKEVKEIIQHLNKKYSEFNFIASDYETLLKQVVKQIKDENIEIPTVTEELRAALTGRVHRSVMSSRLDVKQHIFELETLLIDVLEPLSIMCLANNIDVPWKMIEHCWKELFKSSAHDSYGCTNEDHVNNKIIARTAAGIRVANGVIAMLSRIFSSKIINEKEDGYNKLVLFNFLSQTYKGIYKFETTVKKNHEHGKFIIKQNGKKIPYTILKRNDIGTHERDALTLVLQSVELKPFSYDVLEIENIEENVYNTDLKAKISKGNLSFEVRGNDLIFNNGSKEIVNPFVIAADPSVGDTYDHSPITFNDKKYLLNNYEVIEASDNNSVLVLKASAQLPSGIEQWTNNMPSVIQDIKIVVTILEQNKLHLGLSVENKSLNARLILLVDTQSQSDKWYHDQQFGIYHRELKNKYMDSWEQKDKFGYKWDEYPTNLSAHQWFISNNEANLTVYTNNTKEHEMINFENKNQFAITLYRAFGRFGTNKVAYRPGRQSGANTDAPECQLLGKTLSFDVLLDFNKVSLAEQFSNANQMKAKNFYIPTQWALERTILRWETNISYFDKDVNNRKNSFAPIDLGSQFQMTALYKDVNGRVIARYLNLGETKTISVDYEISRTLNGFAKKSVEVPQFGLVNILLKG